MKRLPVVLLAIAILLAGCKQDKQLPPDEMRDILYDYHLALSMLSIDGQRGDNDSAQAYNEQLYKLAVLRKHDVSEEEFEHSMHYYMRHTDEMEKVYQSLAERMKQEAERMGVSASRLNLDGEFSEDTTNIWPLASGQVLMTQSPYNVVSFRVPADTAFHKGDRFNISFDSHFLFQEGYKDGLVLLAIRLGNDSVVAHNLHFSASTHYNLDVDDGRKLGVKEVKGFIILNRGKDTNAASTLKLLVLDNIRLVRMHRGTPTTENADENTESEALHELEPDDQPANQPAKELPAKDLPLKEPPIKASAEGKPVGVKPVRGVADSVIFHKLPKPVGIHKKAVGRP